MDGGLDIKGCLGFKWKRNDEVVNGWDEDEEFGWIDRKIMRLFWFGDDMNFVIIRLMNSLEYEIWRSDMDLSVILLFGL